MNSNNLQEAYLEVYQLDELTGGKGHPGYKSGSKDHGPMQSGHPADSEKRKDKGGTMSQRHGYHLGDIDDDDDDDEDGLETIVKQQSRDSRERVRKPLRNKVKTARKVLSKEQVDIYDIILSHLLDEGFASTEESADKIILSMSESWFEDIMELNRYAKETGKSFKSGRSSAKGGNEQIKKRVEKEPYLKYGGSREKPKVRGEKPPRAGEPGSGVQDPSHKVALRRTARELNSKKRIGSRFD